MKFKMKSKEGRGEFHNFILEAYDLDDAANKLYEMKGANEYPTLDDYTLTEYHETRGKKPLFKKSRVIPSTRIEEEDWNLIPGNKAAYLRSAISEKLKRDGLK